MRDASCRLLVAVLAVLSSVAAGRPAPGLALAGLPDGRAALSADGPAVVADGATPLTVRVTSPMGRTGVAGPVRIVAQVGHEDGAPVQSVKFFVNRTLIGETHTGPVYAVEWSDDNPFEPTEIAVEATDTSGRVARDSVKLE